MKKPKFIVFDYGETLIHEKFFYPLEGTKAILANPLVNSNNTSAEEIQEIAYQATKQYRRYQDGKVPNSYLEIHNYQFQNYIYEYFGVEIGIDPKESETIFWDAAAPGERISGSETLLKWLKGNNIPMAVVSNLSFSSQSLAERLKEFFPSIDFDFVMSSANYGFRKPHPYLFKLVKQKIYQILGENIHSKEIWFVGDDFNADIVGARNAGMTPVWIHQKEESDIFTVENLKELLEVLKNECEE